MAITELTLNSLVQAPPRPNLKHLRIFLAVARSGTQHEAAAIAGVTQPAISQAIAKLEAQLSLKLFTRNRGGMTLTAAGRILEARVFRMFETISRMRRWVRSGAAFDNRLKMAHLIVLVEIDRTKGHAAASRSLGMSAPAVHRSMREFSELVGTKLIEWSGSAMETSTTGDHMARLAGLALTELHAAWVELDDHAGRSSGQIRFGAMPIARTDILPDVIADVCEAHPAVSIELVEADYEALSRALRRGALDIILGASRGDSVASDLEEQVLFSDELSVVARKDHPLSDRSNIRFEELLHYPWIAPHSGAPTRSDFEKLFQGHPLETGLITSSSLVIVRAILARTDRLTLLSKRRALYEEQRGLITALDFPLPHTLRKICVSTRRDWQPTRLQRAFLQRLHECT